MIKLNDIIDNQSTKIGRFFDFFMQILIILSIITFSVETLPNLPKTTDHLFHLFEVFVVIIFSFEYVARLIISKNKLSYVFSFMGMIDLLSILPFYLSLGLDLRSLRIFRLFRLIRIFKLVRYNEAVDRFYRALLLVKQEIILLIVTMTIIIYLAGVIMYFIENPAQPKVFASVFHGVWWAISTITTVGYGDIYPITVAGKIFTFCLLIIGLVVIAIPAGLFASALSRAIDQSNDKK